MISNIRQAFIYVLCFIVAWPASATSGAIEFTSESVLQTVRKINFAAQPRALQAVKPLGVPVEVAQESLQKLTLNKTAEMSGHVGQTFLFVMAVSGLEIIKTEWMHRGEKNPSDADLKTQIAVAADHILNNAGIYLSLLGAGAAQLGTRYPIEVFSAWLADASARPILNSMLRSSMGVLAATGGWDLGAQLSMEAAYMLKTPEEFERIHNLFGTSVGALSAIFTGDARDKADAALIKQMASNILYVALGNQELRSQWVDRALRTRIMTGEFTVLSAAIAAAGIGTMLLPGGGTVVGFIVGVAAVTVAINIPQSFKNSITKGFHYTRKQWLSYELKLFEGQLVRAIARWNMPLFENETTRADNVDKLLEKRRKVRSSYITLQIEQMRMVFRELFEDKNEDLSASAHEKILKISGRLQKFFKNELTVLDGLDSRVPQDASPRIAASLLEERARVSTVANFFLKLSLELDTGFDNSRSQRTFASFDARSQEFIKFIETRYMRGFDEKDVL